MRCKGRANGEQRCQGEGMEPTSAQTHPKHPHPNTKTIYQHTRLVGCRAAGARESLAVSRAVGWALPPGVSPGRARWPNPKVAAWGCTERATPAQGAGMASRAEVTPPPPEAVPAPVPAPAPAPALDIGTAGPEVAGVFHTDVMPQSPDPRAEEVWASSARPEARPNRAEPPPPFKLAVAPVKLAAWGGPSRWAVPAAPGAGAVTASVAAPLSSIAPSRSSSYSMSWTRNKGAKCEEVKRTAGPPRGGAARPPLCAHSGRLVKGVFLCPLAPLPIPPHAPPN